MGVRFPPSALPTNYWVAHQSSWSITTIEVPSSSAAAFAAAASIAAPVAASASAAAFSAASLACLAASIGSASCALIEDNAIYFDNYSKKGKSKFNSGSLGDFSIYSFNIMKNISALFGGAVVTNNSQFYHYAKKKIYNFKKFPIELLLKQSIIFLVLKILSNKFLYKIIFFKIIKLSHLYNIKFFLKLFYPSLKFKKINFPNYYFSKMSNFSKKLVYFQLLNLQNRKENFNERKLKNIYYKKRFESLNSKNFQILNIKDDNYQNFIDFPVLVNDPKKLNYYLLEYGIESRVFYYNNCEKIFTKKIISSKNSELYEKKIICFPNHRKISKDYIDYIVKTVKKFFTDSSSSK